MEEVRQIEYKKKASESIALLVYYIFEKGYPENAKSFNDKLYTFGNSLTVFPDKYPICRQISLAKRNMHCAVFQKNYIFVYKVIKNTLMVFNVLHAKSNPLFHTI